MLKIDVFTRFIASALLLLGSAGASQAPDPFASPARARVLLFVRTDCPLTNRYAPELQRIAGEFSAEGVSFWLVYPGTSETTAGIDAHVSEYHLPGQVLRDTDHRLMHRAEVTTAPEVAVFDQPGRLLYHGRIDDRYVAFGKARPAAQTHDLEDAIRAVLAGKPVAHPVTHAIGCSLADVE